MVKLAFGVAGAAVVAWVALVAAVYLVPFDEARLRNLDVSMVVRDRNGEHLRAYLARDDRWRLPAQLQRVSPSMIQATLAAEDKRFYQHWGVDLQALARAVISNVKAGRVVSGASTLSMQVAGFTMESRDRSLARKLKQAFRALQLEARWSKSEILECYLTHASYGGNVCGVEAAALRYFNKTAAGLTVGEAALLAGVPQSPERFRPDRHLARSLKRRDYVLDRMVADGAATAEDVERIRGMRIAVGLHEVPLHAPHFCDAVKARYPGRRELRTTLDASMQMLAERRLKAVVDQHRGAGVHNGAVVVMDNETAEIRVMVGSADYWDRFHKGQVNGALGLRSPGSVLKPLIFALAFDSGKLGLDETLFDVPVTISGYSPVNYDRKFRGPVVASKSLAWSLNIPAIEVMRRVGVRQFIDFLKKHQIRLKVNPVGDQGLSLAIGTCSVRLLDMVRLYSSLARGGELKEARWLWDDMGASGPVAPGKRLVSKDAAYAILQVLSDPTLRVPEELDAGLLGLKNVAWKTGTSNGFRDAWTLAVTQNYTIGVWMGNMDGKDSRDLVGSRIAAPLALQLARDLDKDSVPVWKDPRQFSRFEQVCSESGLVATTRCPGTVTGRVMKGIGEGRKCQVHQIVHVDTSTRTSYCANCATSHKAPLDSVVCSFYRSDVVSWLRSEHHPWVQNLPPKHNPECSVSRLSDRPTIVNPAAGTSIVLLTELPRDFQKITLSARLPDSSGKVYWFLNSNLVGVAPAYEDVVVLPEPGRYHVRCVDEQGRSDESWFEVQESDLVEKRLESAGGG